jgi:PAS domain S-box-containing protein
MIFIHNADGKINTFNPATIEILGYSEEEMSSIIFNDFYADINNEVVQDNLINLYSFGKAEYDTYLFKKDKTSVPVHIVGRGIEISGKQYFLEIVIVLPINEKETSNAQI